MTLPSGGTRRKRIVVSIIGFALVCSAAFPGGGIAAGTVLYNENTGSSSSGTLADLLNSPRAKLVISPLQSAGDLLDKTKKTAKDMLDTASDFITNSDPALNYNNLKKI